MDLADGLCAELVAGIGYSNYIREANTQVCLLVQAETVDAMRNLDAIAATHGVDGVFIGPADLSVSMGFPGNPGILATTEEQAREWLAAGALFVAVGVDTMLLSDAARKLLARFKSAAPQSSGGSY